MDTHALFIIAPLLSAIVVNMNSNFNNKNKPNNIYLPPGYLIGII